jgi:hypothetical protein
MPDEKIDSVMAVLLGFQGLMVPIAEPDEWDLAMLREIADEKDESFVSFEDALTAAGFSFDDLQN